MYSLLSGRFSRREFRNREAGKRSCRSQATSCFSRREFRNREAGHKDLCKTTNTMLQSARIQES